MNHSAAALQQEVRDWELTTERLLWLTVSLGLVLLPHVTRVPLWITGGFAVAALWRLHAHRRTKEPPRWAILTLTVVMLPGVYLSYGTLLGRGAGVALLVILAGMKLLETRSIRDAYIVAFLGFFLVITNFLFSQSIANGLYLLTVVILLTATLIGLTVDSGNLKPARRVALASQMLLQAVPVMLLLFVLFPRISAPLWGLPKDAFSARSGLSDTMSPGQISSLSLSEEVAFRVKMLGRRPDPGALYWRGPVLWTTDGQTWRARKAGRGIRPMYSEAVGAPIDYEITLEPHNRRWLFSLDVPATIPAGGQMTEDFETVAVRPVQERRRYSMRSYPRGRMVRMSLEQRALALELPSDRHPRAKALAARWLAQASDARAVVAMALTYFNRQSFYYTLQPPPLPADSVDQFLFESRRGFCEHYSAAFTVLMRAAGIPARIVTGYQGGRYNELGEYLVVRQRDAHAWAEVWIPDLGWTRVDPTAAVAPERIQRGVDAVIPPTIGPGALGIAPSEPVRRAWEWVRQGVDALNNGWNQWVLGYGSRRQAQLLGNFGLDANNYLAISLLLAVGTGVVLGAILWLMSRRGSTLDPAAAIYARLCAGLARKGIARRPGEGPRDFAVRVGRVHPRWRAAIEQATETYIQARYGHRPNTLEKLKQDCSAALRICR